MLIIPHQGNESNVDPRKSSIQCIQGHDVALILMRSLPHGEDSFNIKFVIARLSGKNANLQCPDDFLQWILQKWATDQKTTAVFTS